MGSRDQSFFYPRGWDPALITQVRKTGAYRRPDKVKVPVYNRFFTDAEFRRVLTEVTKFINGRLKEKGHDITLQEGEIGVNVLSEGMDQAIAMNKGFDADAFVDAFGALGIDTFMERYRRLKTWLPDRLVRVVEAGSVADLAAAWTAGRSTYSAASMEAFFAGFTKGRRPYKANDRGSGLLTQSNTNEKGEVYYSLEYIDMELGMYANAAMFAQGVVLASKDIEGFDKLDTEAQFFWSTMYYNSGPGTARRFLKKHGKDYHKESFAGAQNPARSSQYHAIKRMASLGYLLRTVYAEKE